MIGKSNSILKTFLANLSDRNKVPRCWWYPLSHNPLHHNDMVLKLHQNCSETTNKTMLTLLGVVLFNLLTALGASDKLLLAPNGSIKIPFVDSSISFLGFLIVGPMLLIIITVYLHIFFGFWLQLENELRQINQNKAKTNAPPIESMTTIFNITNTMPRILSSFIFYWMVSIALWIIAWKASARPELGYPLIYVACLITFSLIFLQIRRCSENQRREWNKPRWMTLCLLVIIMTYLPFNPESFRRTLDLHQEDLKESWLAFMDLHSAFMHSVNLQKAHLTGTIFNGANLNNANFQGAILDKAHFKGASLKGAQFQGNNLRLIDLEMTDFREGNLQGANLEYARFYGANFKKAILQGADLKYASILPRGNEGSYFSDTNFIHADFEGADLQEARLEHAEFMKVNFKSANFKKAFFNEAILEYAVFSAADFDGAHLDGADLKYADFNGAILEYAVFSGADIEGAHLDGADLKYADLKGIKVNPLLIKMIKSAENWNQAFYSSDLLVQLGLPKDHNEKLETEITNNLNSQSNSIKSGSNLL